MIDKSVASHSNSKEEIQKYTICAHGIQQMVNTQHVFCYSANTDGTEQQSAVRGNETAEAIGLIPQNVNKFKIQFTPSEAALKAIWEGLVSIGLWTSQVPVFVPLCTQSHRSERPRLDNKSCQIPNSIWFLLKLSKLLILIDAALAADLIVLFRTQLRISMKISLQNYRTSGCWRLQSCQALATWREV